MLSERAKSRKVLFLWTFQYCNSHKLLLSILIWHFVHIFSWYISRHTFRLFLSHITEAARRKIILKLFIEITKLEILLKLIYHRFILTFQLKINKKNIEELISESIETIKGEKYKIPNEFSICNYLNLSPDNDKYFIECRIRIWKYLTENT